MLEALNYFMPIRLTALVAVGSGVVVAAGTALAEVFPSPWGVPMKVWEWVLLGAMWTFAGGLWLIDLLRRSTATCPWCGKSVRASSMREIVPDGVLGGGPIKACVSCLGDHVAELERCPVCERDLPRGEMQRASVKQPTKSGETQRRITQLVCGNCIGSGELLVAGARAQKERLL